MKKRIVLCVLLCCFLTLICGCIFDEDDELCPACQNNFYCRVNVPDDNYIKMEVYGKDTLLYMNVTYVRYGTGPYDIVEFLDSYTLRISVNCKGKWLQASDYVFSNEKDNFTFVEFKKTTEAKTEIFNEEQVMECPDLAGYGIVEKKTTLKKN